MQIGVFIGKQTQHQRTRRLAIQIVNGYWQANVECLKNLAMQSN